MTEAFALMRAVVKNTFLAIQADDEEWSAGTFARAKSSPGVLEHPSEAGGRGSFDGQLGRLNNLLSLEHGEWQPDGAQASPSKALEAAEAPSVDELRSLQRKLSEEMSRHARSMRHHERKLSQAMSCSSISTMASGGGMPHALSSASLNTMVSEFCEEFPYEDEPRSRSITQDFAHPCVPKNHDLAGEYARADPEAPPTTLMIRNIPNRYTQRELIRELESLGFDGTFDFLYVPMDKGTMCNVGYAFVNFVNHEEAARCMQVFDNYPFTKHRKARGKIATVSIAHIQGLEANIRHYEKAAVNGSSRSRQRGPVIMASIAQTLAQ